MAGGAVTTASVVETDVGRAAAGAWRAEATVRVGACDAAGDVGDAPAAFGAEDAATTGGGEAVRAEATGTLPAGSSVRSGASIIGATVAGVALSTARTARHAIPPATAATAT